MCSVGPFASSESIGFEPKPTMNNDQTINMRRATAAWCHSRMLEIFRAAYEAAQSGVPKEATLLSFDRHSADSTTDARILGTIRRMIDWAYNTWKEHPEWTLSEAKDVASLALIDIEERVFRQQGWDKE